MLKSIYLGFRKVKVQRVTVVKFGMYNRSGELTNSLYHNIVTASSVVGHCLLSADDLKLSV